MATRTRLRVRVLGTLAIAATCLFTAVAPAAAETILTACSGTCGDYQVTDTDTGGKGAVCGYETTSYDLDFISIRPPLMHGPFSYNTTVQWRYRILRASSSGTTFSGIYLSTWQSAKANNQIPAYAGHGFARRFWYAPESPTGKFEVRINMRWKNSAGTVIGTARVEYDWYKGLWNGNSDLRQDYCIQDW